MQNDSPLFEKEGQVLAEILVSCLEETFLDASNRYIIDGGGDVQ